MTTFPCTRKPRVRPPIQVVVTVSYERVPVAQFAKAWARVIRRIADRQSATPTLEH